MEYPVSGSISIGAYHASNEEDLIALYDHLLENYGLEAALELGDKYPEVFIKTYTVRLTQDQVDYLHLLLGHSADSTAFEIDSLIEEGVSPAAYCNYDRVKFSVDSELGLNISVE